jgi:SAM-dependent methyltransferase
MKLLLPTMAAISTLSVLPAGSEETPELDVPYVPTPQAVVDTMLDMVDLKDGDVVWDLGCGDGRMVITAAKRKNIRGIGVDLDPQRIRESNDNAKKSNVEDKVKFRVADLFKTDFKDATVLTMYLLETVNRKLRPIILRDLAPGARIVSNTFSMGDWKPDMVKVTENESFSRTLYYWVVPSNITGEWEWRMEESIGTINIEQSFQEFGGTVTMGDKEYLIEEGRINGRDITFTLEVPDRGRSVYSATADGDHLVGEIDGKKWTAKRQQDTRQELDQPLPDEDD